MPRPIFQYVGSVNGVEAKLAGEAGIDFVGLANKIAGRFARRIALTFEGAARDLPPALRARAFVTGNPVRAAIFSGDKSRALPRFFPHAAPEDSSLPCVYVTGGAQGSRMI